MTLIAASRIRLAPPTNHMYMDLSKDSQYLDIGDQAVWSLSSCKSGYGVNNLIDNSKDTYWQSDGPQPHDVNIEFMKKTTIAAISIYVDFKQDESYTPSKLVIKAGTHHHDLTLVESKEVDEPTGWINIFPKGLKRRSLRAFLIQISVLSNHQNGRDTHIRQIKVYEHRQNDTTENSASVELVLPENKAFETIR